MATLLDGIISGKEMLITRRIRSKIFNSKTILPELQERMEQEGWTLDAKLKLRVRMSKPKPSSEAFEDSVWLLFFDMGFTHMNRDRYLKLEYDDTRLRLTKQIDVLAIDDETIVLVECKASESGVRRIDLKKEIEAIQGTKEQLYARLRKDFPGRKCVYLLITKDYALSDVDKERLEAAKVIHLDQEALKYFKELTVHLGISARYQMLGNLFAGQKILNIDNKIPAIEGKMGGHTYYAFSIEPEKLLKMCYVLHRNKANVNMMPTYQRLIKKDRLRMVREFVNTGGYFPNSLVISIDTGGRDLQFDLSGLQAEGSISRIGVLHLPQKYRSAYIIDGQHRLYGYSESRYVSSNTIPVVAFVDLPRDEQIKLFMEINENQKTVSKSLRNTLNADLLWDSPDFNKQRQALRLFIAQQLGEELGSPLCGRVVIGENSKSFSCCITLETIQEALKSCDFLSHYGSKNEIIKDGTFDKGTNDITVKVLLPFIKLCFEYIMDNLGEEWNRDESNGGILVINNGISGFLRVFNDIVNHYIAANELHPKKDRPDTMINTISYLLDPMLEFIQKMPIEQREELKRSYGSGGKTRYWRTMQKAIFEKRPEFNPEGLEDYWIDNEKRFNEESYSMIRDIELRLRDDFKNALKKKYGENNWFVQGLPKPVYDAANKLANDKNYEAVESGTQVDPWDCLNIVHYRDIAVYGSNWSDLFEKRYTKPGEEKLAGGKSTKTEWLVKLNRIRNQNFHTYSVTQEEHKFLKELHNWLIV